MHTAVYETLLILIAELQACSMPKLGSAPVCRMYIKRYPN